MNNYKKEYKTDMDKFNDLKTVKYPGGSFYNSTFMCSYEDLVEILGKPGKASSDNKCQYTWSRSFEYDHETIKFEVYDWKEYNIDLKVQPLVRWHIGGKNRRQTETVRSIINNILCRTY